MVLTLPFSSFPSLHTQTLLLSLSPFILSSESPFSEPGGEAEPDGGTETQTSEEGTL